MAHPAPAEKSSGVRIVRVEAEHLPLLADFIREFWDAEATPEAVARARARAAADNPAAGGEEPPTFLFLHSGRPVGHVTTIPIRLWLGERQVTAHWLKGLMVSPQHRNGPVGFTLLKEAVGQLDTALAMVVQPAPRRLFSALGFRDMGALPNRVRAFRPGRILRRLDRQALGFEGRPVLRTALMALQAPPLTGAAGLALRGAAGLWSALAGRVPGGFSAEHGPIDRDACDDLWSEVRDSIRAAPERGGAYLAWRYRGEEGRYAHAGVYEAGALAGLAVVRRPGSDGDPRLGGARVAVLSDLLCQPQRSDAAVAVLAAAEGLARRMKADALLCSASHSALAGPLRRRGYFSVPGNVHVLARFGSGLEDPPPLDSWWLTRGDSDADEVF